MPFSRASIPEDPLSVHFLPRLREDCLARAGIDVRFLSGMPALRRAGAQLDAMDATERLSVLTRFGPRAAPPTPPASVTRIIVPPVLTSGTALSHLQGLGQEGAHIRVSPRAVNRLTIVNRAVALVDVSGTTHRAEPEGVKIRNADLIRAVVMHFEDLWRSASPLSGEGSLTLDRFTARQRRILELLAEGMTDDMVSRELGLSARSIRAEVAVIRDLLGAESRFAAGMKYAALLGT